MNRFIHLHVHTQYSLLDGMIRIKGMIRKAKEYGMTAVAMTDHGNMHGAVDFYKQAKDAGIKAIIGSEFYFAPRSRLDKQSHQPGGKDAYSHLTLLAKNETGYKNLMKLSSLSFLEGFYYKPRIDLEILKEHSEGIIIMSGCLRGSIATLLMAGERDKALELANTLRDIVGDENFYIEIMETGTADQSKANVLLKALAKEQGFRLVATNDCHYLNRDDAKSHEVLVCIQTGKRLVDDNRMRMETDQFYFKSPDEMMEAFKDVPEAIENTVRIADMCDLKIDLDKTYMPGMKTDKPPDEALQEQAETMTKQVEEGFLRKCPQGKPEYRQRLDYELTEIKRMGYPGYFLIVADFIRYAREKGIPVGPGRGSAAGSLVAYALDITDVDPIRYDLYFERFLNPERKSLPDIDTDLSPEGRGVVIDYLVEKYGKDKVTQISTFGRMQAKMVVRDVGRAMGMSYTEADRLAKLIPDDLSMTIDRAIETNIALKEAINTNPEAARLFEHAKRLEGLKRHMSTHAAGVVISDVPLQERVPICVTTTDDVVTQYSMKDVEAAGLVKFDLLGLKTLTAIKDTIDIVKELHGVDIDWNKISLSDRQTYKLLAAGETDGVFQLESSGIRELMRKMKPNRIEDLIALVALYRPGPLQTGMDQEYVKRKHHPSKIKYDHDLLKPILQETYGVILYQEQVMMIARGLAGYSMSQADDLRKSMGKKITEMMAKEQPRFIAGAVERGVQEDVALKIWSQMETFAQYGFNKSHSTAYALIAFRTAYLKAHFPTEFYAALLTSENDNRDKIIKYLRECRNAGIAVLPPHINESGSMFKVVNGKIRFGLAAVKNVGGAAVEAIIQERGKGKFEDLYDFYCRCHKDITKTVVTSLVYAGAFDGGSYSRGQLMIALKEIFKNHDSFKKDIAAKSRGQIGLFDDDPKEQTGLKSLLANATEPPVEDKNAILLHEKESLGFYITGHPFDEYRDKMEAISAVPIAELGKVRDGSICMTVGTVDEIHRVWTRKQERMARVILDDGSGSTEVIVFPEPYQAAEEILSKGNALAIEGEVKKEDDGIKIIARNISLFIDAPVRPAPVLENGTGGDALPEDTRGGMRDEGAPLEEGGGDYVYTEDGVACYESEPDYDPDILQAHKEDSPVNKIGYQYELFCPQVVSSSVHLTEVTMQQLKDILRRYPGENPCILTLSLADPNGAANGNTDEYVVDLKGYDVDGSEMFMNEVIKLLGKSQVKEKELETRAA